MSSHRHPEQQPLMPQPSNSTFRTQGTVDENDVVDYVIAKRTSLAVLNQNDILPDPFTSQAALAHMPDRLPPVRSRASLFAALFAALHYAALHLTYGIPDVSEILSTHMVSVPEPKTSVLTEMIALAKMSLPLVATFMLKYSLTVALVFSVGRLGQNELAAVSLSSMTANISGYAIIQGISTCLDTLCAQAFGREDHNAVGVHFIRCTYLLLLLYIPMAAFWLWGVKPTLLALLGEEAAPLCALAGDYLGMLSCGLPGFILFENATHFLQCQGVFHALTYVLLICAPLNAVLNYYLVWDPRFGLGFVGAPLLVVITNWLMCALIFAYIFKVKGYECWPKERLWDQIFFRNWKRMISLSIPGVLMVEAEWLAFEIVTFSAALFGTLVLAAQSIVTTLCALLYQIPMAIAITASTRVAWYIGAASEAAAKSSVQGSTLFAFIIGLLVGAILYVSRWYVPTLFSNDESVIALSARVFVICSVYQVNDFLTVVCSGVLRGQGRQHVGGYINLVSFYLIALPCAFFFAFYCEWELVGLWLGMIIALLVASIWQLYYVMKSDWDLIINECISEAVFGGE